MNNWIETIDDWLSKRKSFKSNRDDIIALFKVAMENTMIPDKSWFGFPPTKTSLSILFGRIYLIGIFERTIEIIVDADISKEIGFNTRIVGSSVSNGLNLYWITANFDDIKKLISNDKIWQHYKLASIKVNTAKGMITERKDWLVGKYLVNEIFNEGQINFDTQTIEKAFQRELKLSNENISNKRLERLKNANKKPISILSQSKVFLRNADVVIEVLKRAQGYCEYCESPAPFVKDSDGIGFLEVHHIIPLAENGDDTVENAVALCPNCHRQAHYGKSKFDITKFSNLSIFQSLNLKNE